MKLEGKTALVTGSGRNIGRATVLELAREGANVVVNSRTNRKEAEAVAQEAQALGVKALAAVADVSDKDQVDGMVAGALEEFGRIDILVSNAAIRPRRPFLEVTLKDWRQILGVILDGAFFCSQAVVPSMMERGFGRIIYMAGDGTFVGASPRTPVNAAKMGLVGMARGLATELAPHGITVNVISPGRIDTSRNAAWYSDAAGTAKDNTADIPLNRMGKPTEIAAACAFLASDEGGFITGQTLHMNGGAAYF